MQEQVRVRLRRLLSSTAARWSLVVLVGLTAAAGSTAAWGASSQPLGPLQARVGLRLAWEGGTRVDVPPLGRLQLATHRGPLQVRATVTDVRPDQARALLRAGSPARVLSATVAREARAAALRGLARSVAVALLAAVLTCAVVFRRLRAGLVGGLAVVVALAGGGLVAGLTVRPQALSEPRFSGTLARLPGLVGAVRDFGAYSERVAELTVGVSRLYGAVTALPAAPGRDEVRVLWVSDLHNNPEALTVMTELVAQFEVAAVFDTGDLTDLGTAVEARQLAGVGRLGVPYVYVRGNHDSKGGTQAVLSRLDGVVVLDDEAVVDVAGLRVAGTGDPLFRPNRGAPQDAAADREALTAAGQRLADRVAADPRGAQVALVHEPPMALPLYGTVPLVLSGHTHERASLRRGGTLGLTQGSSGAAGLRTLDGDEVQTLQMSVLHLGRADGRLLAVDDVTIGGVGERSVTVQRVAPESYREDDEDAPTPVPTSTPSPSPTPGLAPTPSAAPAPTPAASASGR